MEGDGWLSWQRTCIQQQLSGFESRWQQYQSESFDNTDFFVIEAKQTCFFTVKINFDEFERTSLLYEF